jgi:hypothetical protein
MELNSNTLNALKSLSGSSDETETNISLDSYNLLIKTIFDSFIINIETKQFQLDLNNPEIESIKQISSGELKEITAAIYTIITEFARNDSDSNAVT